MLIPFLLRQYSTRKMKVLFTFLIALSSIVASAQATVKGVVKDVVTGETVPGATVLYGDGKGTVTDLDGKYSFSVPAGTYTIKVQYVGMLPIEKVITVGNSNITLDFDLETEAMKEVEVIADVAVGRKTPVAYTDISSVQIKEELGTRDLPMLFNSTPGIYATQSGGGDGDSRINIRGFNQRYVAVMIDGIPMNDMENGWVYWSNWFGLDGVLSKTQIQRGLGASKLAIPSVGGTINMLTQGIDQKQSLSINSEFGNNMNLRETVSFNSGRLKGGWGITSAVSVSKNNGWVENLYSKRLFYYLKIQKEWLNHSLAFSIMGSPQEHAQRPVVQPIYLYDTTYAASLGVDVSKKPLAMDPNLLGNYGLRNNIFWGKLSRNRYDENAPEEIISERVNFYHKPILNLKHFWNIGERLVFSNNLYASFGDGGGTALSGTYFNADGKTDFQRIYYENTNPIVTPFSISLPYDTVYTPDKSQFKSRKWIEARMNDHFWMGALATFKFKVNKRLEFSGGFDGRYYYTDRYNMAYDLLGGDYIVPNTSGDDKNNPDRKMIRQGDAYEYKIRTYVKQGGLFFLGEYSVDRWSAFINVTGSINAYNRTDYFAKKTTDGNYQTSGWKTIPGGTVKGGASYNLNRNHSVYANAGYLSRAQMVNNVLVGIKLIEYHGVKNEEIIAQELGYKFNTKDFNASLNIYNTIWNNKPVVTKVSSGTDVLDANVPGMNALHQGVELEAQYKYNDKIKIDGVVSLGDWRWTSTGEAIILNESGTKIIDTLYFNAKGVKVGDAAQTQLSLGIRYEPLKDLYISPRVTYFENYFSDFQPESLQGENGGIQSWKIPAYYNLDVNMGYSHPIGQKKYRIGLKVNLMNITDVKFISDARNNQIYNANDPTTGEGFNAGSAGVYMGMGFRWNVGVFFKY